MTTYTSLLSGDPQYIAEDWTVTIREKHAYDLPQLNELRQMIRDWREQPHPRAQMVASYNVLVNDFRRSQRYLSRADQELINRVLSILRQELG